MNNRLEDLRELSDFSKKEFAKILGVSDSIYARWENSKDFIPTKRLYQIASFYNVNIDYILALTNKKIEIITKEQIDINIVAKRTFEIRKDMNESLREFAKRLNTSGSTWHAYEKGKVLILGAFLIEVCKNYNYSADWILGRTNDKFIH